MKHKDDIEKMTLMTYLLRNTGISKTTTLQKMLDTSPAYPDVAKHPSNTHKVN